MPGENQRVQLKRHFISLELKIQILDRLNNREKISHVAKSLDLNEATIRTIQKNEQKIRASVTAGCSISANLTARPRAPIQEKMEKALNIWINDCSKKRIPVSVTAIQHKALTIYTLLKENGESATKPDFVASKGWFDRFRKRFSLQNIKTQEDSTLIDHKAAKLYPKELQKIIKQGGYTTHQVFNANETGHWWKEMPKRPFVSKNEESVPCFKVSRDRLTLLMCSNASGDHIVQPMLVYKCLKPRVMKNLNTSDLPVYWTANKDACLTTNLFKQWFLNCFVPSVKNYLLKKNLDTKILLILDNAPGHPKDLTHPNVKIIFLPPNTTSLLQPLDQGIIATFKTLYIRKSLQWIMNRANDESIQVMKAWKHFTILDCINLITSSIKEISPLTLNACWKYLWPESIHSQNRSELPKNGMVIVQNVSKSLGREDFYEINVEDTQNTMIKQETCEENFVEMASGINQIKSENYSTEKHKRVPPFTLKSIKKGLELAEELEKYFLNEDPSTERSTTFKTELDKCLAPYHEIYKDYHQKANDW